MEQKDLRVSDTDRERAAELLQGAVGEGYISLDEFDERSAAVFASRTRGELDALLADLPTAQQSAPAAVPRGEEVTERQELRSTGSTLERKGGWQVASGLRLRTRFCDTNLDFTDAVFVSSVVDIEIDDTASSTVLVLPENTTVDCGQLATSWSDLDNRLPSGPPRGRPHLVVHGKVRAGSVVIRHLSKITSWWRGRG